MGWTAYYQLVRAKPLTDKELAELAKLVRYAQKRKWDAEAFGLVVATKPHSNGVLAKGWNKLSDDESSWDPNLLCEILNKLQKKFPSATVRVADDFDVVKWGADGFSREDGEQRPLVADTEDAGWESVLARVPIEHTYPPALSAAIDKLAAGTLSDADRTDEKLVAAAFKFLSTPEVKAEPIKALLDACDPDTVARVGLAKYGSCDSDARSVLASAFSAVRDVPALAGPFVSAWSKPRGRYFYGDMPIRGPFGAAIAAQPVVRDRLIADFMALEQGRAEREIECRRTEAAAILLGRSKDRGAVRLLADCVRRHRGKKLEGAQRYNMYLPALEGVALAEDPAYVPTLLLALERTGATYRGEAQALEHSLVANLELAAPLVRKLLGRELAANVCLDAVRLAGPAAASLADAVEPYLEHPHWERRAAARAAMAAINGVEPRWDDDRELRDIEAHLLHRDHDVRRAALRAVHDRKDTSLMVALCIAQTVDAYLMAPVVAFSSLPFSWWDWQGLIPKNVIEMRGDERLAWARGEGASTIGEQRLPPVIAAIADKPIRDVVLAYGPLTIRHDDATRAQLVALEDAAFAAA